MAEITTKDCKVVLDKWLQDNHDGQGLGKWKRTRKAKNSQGQWVRTFVNTLLNLQVEVTEMGNELNAQKINEENKTVTPEGGRYGQADDGPQDYYYAFSNDLDETYGEFAFFVVVEKKYFDKENCMNSVHYSDYHYMPKNFDEEMESTFVVHDMTVEQAKKILDQMGFTENQELADIING